MKLSDALKETYFFDALSDEEVTLIASTARLLHLEAGETIFHEGDDATSFYIVYSGQVQIYKTGEGKEIILHLFGPGDIFAEFPIFSGVKEYPANALCLKDSVILAIEGKPFREAVATKPEILMKMVVRMSQRLREFNALIEDLSLRSVDARLAKYLLYVSKDTPAEAAIEVQKRTLASILGTIPETLSRAFKRLTKLGVIRMRQQQVHIVDRDALQQIADTM